ncbi:tetratricopeptide repeat protein [Kutzneria sp. CA-103260]|uniref:tetratricopeptide repeat protein n=1 Tax=Kutzneria sp. CA-103260 TaxID=2802641 RepID=UPI001BEE2CA2|nr:tetratricopeptide repeat protein [Kutzneria sp. CA-103260]QUQ62666.1 valosin containing protein-1 [Kutzneria sp. CA-103260]
MDTPLIRSLRAAVEAVPGDVTLRLHLAEQLLAVGDAEGAAEQAATALQHDPASQAARAVLGRALGAPGEQVRQPQPVEAQQESGGEPEEPEGSQPDEAEAEPEKVEPVPVFDWAAAEEDLGFLDVEEGRITLKDVGGLKAVKERLEAAFLAPMRNPELRKLYGKSMRGGLMLYGPPGCGKTFVARAVAGELGAKFISVTLSDVLNMYIGQSERNLHEMFETARRNAPCVLFLDEIDALGQKRSQLRSSAMRGTVNQLLVELDDVRDSNEGVFVLAATNHPWDVDSALKRPGRFDRTLLVLPPDLEARQAILAYHLKDRPTEGIDLGKLAKRTDGYSGADLAHACEAAAEKALLDSVRRGQTRMIGMADLEEALKEIKPSTVPWFSAARNVAMFANEGGTYDELLAYLKKHRLA